MPTTLLPRITSTVLPSAPPVANPASTATGAANPLPEASAKPIKKHPERAPNRLLQIAYEAAAAAKTKLNLPGHGHILPQVVTKDFLQRLLDENESPDVLGRFVQGIPGTKPDQKTRAITILDLKTGECITAGTRDVNGKLKKYSQQSMSKPVAEVLALTLIGEKEFNLRVGFNASGRPYNAKETYNDRPGVPFNSNVNIGALKVWDILISEAKARGLDPLKMYMDFLKKLANNDELESNDEMAIGQFDFQPADGSLSNNMKLLNELKDHGNLINDPKEVYLPYCKACAVMIDTEDSARIRSKFNDGTDPKTGEVLIPPAMARLTARSMAISGLYDESGSTYSRLHISAKSGVDGGIMMSLPSKVPGNPDLIIATHHAGLNPRGNSHEGLKLAKDLAKRVLIFPNDAKILNTKAVVKGTYKQIRALVKQGNISSQIQGAFSGPVVSKKAIHEKLLGAVTGNGEERLTSAINKKIDENKAQVAEEMDAQLQARLEGKSSQEADALRENSDKVKEIRLNLRNYKGDFYLKSARPGQQLDEDTLIMREADKNGKMKCYYLVPDTHWAEKIVVAEDR